LQSECWPSWRIAQEMSHKSAEFADATKDDLHLCALRTLADRNVNLCSIKLLKTT
jgi:hypothetical protein